MKAQENDPMTAAADGTTKDQTRPAASSPATGPSSAAIADWTDQYFLKTKAVVQKFGDAKVTYAVFMRRPVVSAPRLALDWLQRIAAERNTTVDVDLIYAEGKWVGAGEPLLYLHGSLVHLADLETLFLQKLGPACVAAFNAYTMCTDLAKVSFIAMDARHCAGLEMAELMAYAASVGSGRAQRKSGAKGFIGNATEATAHYFGREHALGTMPHALIGYAGSTLRAAEMFHETFPDQPMTVLVDYFARETTDAMTVCRRFSHLASQGKLSVRIDTPGSRFIEGLDPTASYAVMDRHCPHAIRGYRNETELRHLVGAGVSAAAIWHIRDALDREGFQKVGIVASSGFDPAKCKVMAEADAPIDVIGTGSFLPQRWTETYATADIIDYDGKKRVKVGREFLFRK
ncbi:MAG TPA: nicotinate phosphoribosyltransferase [Dongiaceae bacterium]|nr:nicotinate phosphoribosyltransferase [Dongiaceae bacterium]